MIVSTVILYLLIIELILELLMATNAGDNSTSSRRTLISAWASGGRSLAPLSSKVHPVIEPIKTKITAETPAKILPHAIVTLNGRCGDNGAVCIA